MLIMILSVICTLLIIYSFFATVIIIDQTDYYNQLEKRYHEYLIENDIGAWDEDLYDGDGEE